MATVIHLDTHIVVWLWIADSKKLRPMRKVLEDRDLIYSPMVELEVEFLHEIGRVKPPAAVVLAGLAENIGLRRCPANFGDVVAHARAMKWTRDPFDRLIVATAMVAGAELLTRDETILEHFGQARAC